jgi:hypothetical protein
MALSGRAKKILLGAGVVTAGVFAAAGTALASGPGDPAPRAELQIIEDGAPGTAPGDCPFKDGTGSSATPDPAGA